MNEDEQALIEAAREWASSIAFYDEKRGYVCYSVAHSIDLQNALLDVAFRFRPKYEKIPKNE